MTTEQGMIENKAGLLERARQLGNVARVRNILGYSCRQVPFESLTSRNIALLFFSPRR
jgi:hypothetical protein